MKYGEEYCPLVLGRINEMVHVGVWSINLKFVIEAN